MFFVSRAEASAPRLAELNPYVNIQTSTSAISEGDFAFLSHFQVFHNIYIQVKYYTFVVHLFSGLQAQFFSKSPFGDLI